MADARLRAIAIYTLSSSFILWYGIEKIFLKNTLSLSLTQIASLPLIYMITSLVLELPSSILSDRWSRSKTLALSLGFLALSSIVGGLSKNYGMYCIATVFWGVASSFHSGTSQALLYDSLKESNNENLYLKINVFMQRLFTLSLFVSMSLGGYMLGLTNSRFIYLLEAPTAVIGSVAMFKLKEPTFHKKDQELSAYKHLSKTINTATINNQLISRILVSALMMSVYASYVYEFAPLSYLSIGVNEKLIGLLTAAASTLSYLLFAGLVEKFKAKWWQILIMSVSIASAVIAFFASNWILLFAAMFSLQLTQSYANDINDAKIHDLASSSERASVASLAGLVGGLVAVIFFPLLSLSMNKFGDSGYLLVSAFAGFIILLLSIYVYIKEGHN